MTFKTQSRFQKRQTHDSFLSFFSKTDGGYQGNVLCKFLQKVIVSNETKQDGSYPFSESTIISLGSSSVSLTIVL